MKRRCKHNPDHVVIKYDCDGLPDPLELSWRECLDCGSWLSLGPSNDSPAEVQIEIAAAARAVEYDGETAVLGYDRFDWCPDGGNVLCDICLVLYLARAIHTSQREERD